MPAQILWPGVSNWWPEDCIWPIWFTAADKYDSNIVLYKQTRSIVQHHNISSNYFLLSLPFRLSPCYHLVTFPRVTQFFCSICMKPRNILLNECHYSRTHETKHKLRTIRTKNSVTNNENGVNTNFKPDINKLSTNQSCKFLRNLHIKCEISAQYLTGQFDWDFLSNWHLDQQLIILFTVFWYCLKEVYHYVCF
jgi:hypothetical protein